MNLNLRNDVIRKGGKRALIVSLIVFGILCGGLGHRYCPN